MLLSKATAPSSLKRVKVWNRETVWLQQQQAQQ